MYLYGYGSSRLEAFHLPSEVFSLLPTTLNIEGNCAYLMLTNGLELLLVAQKTFVHFRKAAGERLVETHRGVCEESIKIQQSPPVAVDGNFYLSYNGAMQQFCWETVYEDGRFN